MFKYLKYKIRLLAIKFYKSTEYFILPEDLLKRISSNSTNHKELCKIQTEINEIKSKYPGEIDIVKAETIIERTLILEKRG